MCGQVNTCEKNPISPVEAFQRHWTQGNLKLHYSHYPGGVPIDASFLQAHDKLFHLPKQRRDRKELTPDNVPGSPAYVPSV